MSNIKISRNPINPNEVLVSMSMTLSALEAAEGGLFGLEERLAKHLNELGLRSMELLLTELDSKGEAMTSGGVKWTSKGKGKRVIETPFGAAETFCHVYQTSAGGVTRVPLEERAKLVSSATPRMAQMVASKFAQNSAANVARDFAQNHQRPISGSYAQDLSMAVAALVNVRMDDKPWVPLSGSREVATISVGVDGAHINTRTDQWRQAMAGTIALYDKDGERLETLYVGGGPGATAPQGKAVFFERMEGHIAAVRRNYPLAHCCGISDGAVDLQAFLARHTTAQLLDFHHAAEYLTPASAAFCPEHSGQSGEAREWAHQQRHVLLEQPQGALEVYALLKLRQQQDDERRQVGRQRRKATSQDPQTKQAKLATPLLPKLVRTALNRAVTYIGNNITKMNYQAWASQKLPIGSGVTEAACKTLVKQRLCQSGMRWSIDSADALLQLRALYLTPSQWDRFWNTFRSPAKKTPL